MPLLTRAYHLVFSLFFLGLLSGCGGTSTAIRIKAQDHFRQGNFSAAEIDTIQPDILNDSKNRLLTLLELGSFAHYNGDYEKSNIYFFRAKEIARQLFTVSTREQIASGIVNDNAASYVGMDYEISLLHYFIAANFILMSESKKLPAWKMPEIRSGDTVIFSARDNPEKILSNNNRVEALSKARAELLDWNSFLQEVRERNRGQPYYKDDLLNKVFAAYIHQIIGSLQDKNIAKILYKDANSIMIKAYGAYPTYNSKSKEYVEQYSDFPKLGLDKVQENFIEKSQQFLNVEKQIQVSSSEPTNTFYLLEYGNIPEKKERTFVIGLTTLFSQIENPVLRSQLEQVGTHLIIELAPEFGLAFFGAAVVGATTGKNSSGDNPQYISEAVDSAVGFEFKLPAIEEIKLPELFQLKFIRTSDSKTIVSPVSITTPLADIAKLNIDRRASGIALKTGVRVGLKYLAALLPAIIMYKKIDGPKFVKMLAAMGVWMAGKKIVDYSEAADLRAWNLLPQWIGMVETKLPQGEYTVTLEESSGKQIHHLKNILITKENEKNVYKARVFPENFIANSPVQNIIK